jgi:3-methylfumaryl-CoA hydratase
MTEINVGYLRTWIGRKEQFRDVISQNPAAALAATLDHKEVPQYGDPLRPLWHWVYFTPLTRQSELGTDGHPLLGGFMPPVPLARRMWAGGRLRFLAPIHIGDEVSKETEIINVAYKPGRQGDLIFVTLRHCLSTARGLAIEEEQDIVYRQPVSGVPVVTSQSPASGHELAKTALWRDPIEADARLLFRYSALTFNAHRIHYDEPYAREEEGYAGLVVHGPLTATLIVDRLLAHAPGRLVEFAFRGQSPLLAGTRFNLCGNSGDHMNFDLWAEAQGGHRAMSATAKMEAAT